MDEILRPSRRGLLVGLLGLVAAPAIVRCTSLMPVKHLDRMGIKPPPEFIECNINIEAFRVAVENFTRELYGQYRMPLAVCIGGPSKITADVSMSDATRILPGDVVMISMRHELGASAVVRIRVSEVRVGEGCGQVRGYVAARDVEL